MKKYLLFAHNDYESSSFNDFIGSFDSIDEAKAQQTYCDNADIVMIGENEFILVSAYESRFIRNRGWVTEWYDEKEEV